MCEFVCMIAQTSCSVTAGSGARNLDKAAAKRGRGKRYVSRKFWHGAAAPFHGHARGTGSVLAGGQLHAVGRSGLVAQEPRRKRVDKLLQGGVQSEVLSRIGLCCKVCVQRIAVSRIWRPGAPSTLMRTVCAAWSGWYTAGAVVSTKL